MVSDFFNAQCGGYRTKHVLKDAFPLYIEKGLHKGTSEAPVLSESERERCSKGNLSMGRRQA